MASSSSAHPDIMCAHRSIFCLFLKMVNSPSTLFKKTIPLQPIRPSECEFMITISEKIRKRVPNPEFFESNLFKDRISKIFAVTENTHEDPKFKATFTKGPQELQEGDYTVTVSFELLCRYWQFISTLDPADYPRTIQTMFEKILFKDESIDILDHFLLPNEDGQKKMPLSPESLFAICIEAFFLSQHPPLERMRNIYLRLNSSLCQTFLTFLKEANGEEFLASILNEENIFVQNHELYLNVPLELVNHHLTANVMKGLGDLWYINKDRWV